jgi:hypothetical protein
LNPTTSPLKVTKSGVPQGFHDPPTKTIGEMNTDEEEERKDTYVYFICDRW